MSVSRTIPESLQKCQLIRSVVSKDKTLLVDANQFWDRDEAISSVKGFKQIHLYCTEESTSSDDILGYIEIMDALREFEDPVRVSCGEMCANVLFKQFLKISEIDFWNINVGRLGRVNEALTVYLMAKKCNGKFAIGDNYISWILIIQRVTFQNRSLLSETQISLIEPI